MTVKPFRSALRYAVILAIVPVLLMSAACTTGGGKETSLQGKKLRKVYKEIKREEVNAMIKRMGFFEYDVNRGSGGIVNRFKLKTEKKQYSDQEVEERVVIDEASGLVWLQSGPFDKMTYHDTVAWIKQLNKTGYCGFYKWRLPTLEEALTLMESERVNRRYIDPVFSPIQGSIRTGDISTQWWSWGVSYQHGRVFRVGVIEPDFCRLVTEYIDTNL